MTKEDKIEALNMFIDAIGNARWSNICTGDYHAENALDALSDALFRCRAKLFNDNLKGGD